MTSTASTRTIGGRNRLLAAPAVAGVAYLLAWVIGLAVWPSNLDVAASGGQVVAAYTGHRGVAMAQSLLVHGVAAVALAVVVLALGQAARRRDAGPLARATVVAGVGAAVVSLVQCALGLWLAGWAVPDSDAGRAGALFAAINRLDGVKMLALAAMAAGGAVLVRRTHLLPGWLGYQRHGPARSPVVDQVHRHRWRPAAGSHRGRPLAARPGGRRPRVAQALEERLGCPR